ncbi:MAG TPA: hypothetical protein PKA06_15430, partial [Gemmatales bacterium]|nr:hypothetical protein [Gemmatales bacterium]
REIPDLILSMGQNRCEQKADEDASKTKHHTTSPRVDQDKARRGPSRLRWLVPRSPPGLTAYRPRKRGKRY